ncbi:unnamed protein product [Gadus morhua 'NCC']
MAFSWSRLSGILCLGGGGGGLEEETEEVDRNAVCHDSEEQEPGGGSLRPWSRDPEPYMLPLNNHTHVFFKTSRTLDTSPSSVHMLTSELTSYTLTEPAGRV